MISLIVTCRVAPIVRPALTKSCIPASLSTVLQRTPQQFEKHPFQLFMYLENCAVLFTGQTCYNIFFWRLTVTSTWLDYVTQVPLICAKAKQGSPLSVVDITALTHIILDYAKSTSKCLIVD